VPVLTYATVFTALCTFLGSVYFASKRTMGSMLTAMAGAVLNIALNLLLIPPYGAMGASVATFASYFAVCILRLATGRRLIPFKGEWGRLMVNTLLMGGLATAVTLSGGPLSEPVAWGIAAGVFAVMLVLNLRAVAALLKDGKQMLKRR
jgi:O-antigen/teichoic acid export membrane protein